MLIMTVTLNPAVDKTIQIDNFGINQVNRVDSMRIDAGGKGINVSHTIKTMGRESIAFAVIGGQAGAFIKKTMEAEGVAFKCLEIEAETRTNLKIVDVVSDTHTDINELGPIVEDSFEEDIINLINVNLENGDILVLSGSLLPGLTKGLYRKLTELASHMGALVILDAEGEQLIEALEASPDIIKPNFHELSGLVERPLSSNSDVIDVAQTLINEGKVKKGVLVSLGEDGSLWITRNQVIEVKPIKTDVKSTVGAGDAMVAALAIALDEKMSDEDMLRLATAAAVARISTDGPIACGIDKISSIAAEVVLKAL